MTGEPGVGKPAHAGRQAFPIAAILTAAMALYQVALGIYFALLRPPLLPEDVRFAATTASRLASAAPRLETWLGWVFTVAGGQMVAVGLLVGVFALQLWGRSVPKIAEIVAFAAVGLASPALMSAVNFSIGSDFRWLLVVPVLIWILAFTAMVRLRLS